MRFYKGAWLPTNRFKANIIFHGFLSRTKVGTKEKKLDVISKYLEGHRMSNMSVDNNLETKVYSAV